MWSVGRTERQGVTIQHDDIVVAVHFRSERRAGGEGQKNWVKTVTWKYRSDTEIYS